MLSKKTAVCNSGQNALKWKKESHKMPRVARGGLEQRMRFKIKQERMQV